MTRRRARPGPAQDLVAVLRGTLVAHHPTDGREEQSCAHVRAALARLAHPFDEDADPEHVTASGIVVGARGTVLHVHKRLRRWLQPGGHIAAGETPWDAARREAHEETGLAVTHPEAGPVLLHVDVHEGARGHTHLDLRYLLLASDSEPSPPAGESPDVRWFAWDDALAVADEALVGALRTARARPEVGKHTADERGDAFAPRTRHNGERRE